MRMKGLVIALLMVAFTLFACSDDDDSSGASGIVDLPDGAAAVVDDYYEAVTVQHDGDAMLALVTEEFEFVTDDATIDREAWADDIDGFDGDFAVERLEEATAVGGGRVYIVSQPEQVSGTGLDDVAFSVMRVIEIDGTWLVHSHQYSATPAP